MKRIESADAIRGFSLFGIFMANLLIFQYGLSGKSYMEYYSLSPVNDMAFKIVQVIFEGSFLPIFAILFGFSMDKLFQSMKNKNIKWKRFKLLCRACGLMVLGLLHSYFIWEGDILLAYGIAMLIFIPFIGLPKWFFKLVTILFVIAGIGLLSTVFISPSTETAEINNTGDAEYMTILIDEYSNGSYSEILDTRQNLEDPLFAEKMDTFGEGFILVLLVSMLIPALLYAVGVYLSKSEWFSKDATHLMSSKIYIYLIPVSIIMKSSIYWLDNEDVSGTLNLIFGLLLSFSFMCLIKLLYQRYEASNIIIGMKNIGKLSLTMYIMQSVIGTTIFYGYGLGWFGADNFIVSVTVFIACYILQMIIATLYLKRFTYGPLEYVLRTVTYMNFRKRKWSRD